MDRLDPPEHATAPGPARTFDGDGPERSPTLQTVELPPLLRESIDLFVKGTDPRGRKVRFQTDWEPLLPTVRTDPGRLLQVLLSLYSNAYDAMATVPMDGEISVSTKPKT